MEEIKQTANQEKYLEGGPAQSKESIGSHDLKPEDNFIKGHIEYSIKDDLVVI